MSNKFNNIGHCSSIEIKNDRLIKYIIEPKDDKLFNIKRQECVNKKILNLKLHREIKINNILDKIKFKYLKLPKFYSSNSGKITFDQNIFKNIYKSKHYKPNNINMYKLEYDYIKSDNLFDYFLKNGLKIKEDKIINNIPDNIMINVYSQIFTGLYEFIKNDIIPYDITNLSNFLFFKNNIYFIDYVGWHFITSKEKTNTNDIFKWCVLNIFETINNNRLHTFKILCLHKNYLFILKKSFEMLIKHLI